MMDTIQLAPDQARHWRVLDPQAHETVEGIVDKMLADARADGHRTDIFGVALQDASVGCDAAADLYLEHDFERLTLRRTAFRQLCAFLKAPPDYLTRLPRELGLKCLNAGLVLSPETTRTLRMADASIRAVVSPRFGKLDDDVVYPYFLEELSMQGVDVLPAAVATGTTTNLRTVLPEKVKGPEGQDLRVGFDLRNSELASGSVSLRVVLYDLLCTNGMVVQRSQAGNSWRHVGDPERLREGFETGIPTLMDEARELALLPAKLHSQVIDISKARKLLARRNLTKPQQLLALGYAAARAAGDPLDPAAIPDDTARLTMWHLVSGVTRAAQLSASNEVRLEMETQAGMVAA